ncbi:MAG: hypothetical protein ABFS43_15675 [Thermodesulfobacteriota bacterium]
MQTKKLFIIITFILLVVTFLPTALFSTTVYYDFNGNAIENYRYKQTVVDRDNAIKSELKYGYTSEIKDWKDPIKLRKRRIEQWKDMRSSYSPESLPSKIENNTVNR